MVEIRLCMERRLSPERKALPYCGSWVLDAPEQRRDFEATVSAGNGVFGAGTHWIEERQAAPSVLQQITDYVAALRRPFR